MATTIADGNVFADAATVWDTGVAPIAPEQAVIRHDITVDGNWDIGHSPNDDSSWAIDVESGSLVFLAGYTHTIRGGMRCASGSNIAVNAGCHITLDDTGAAAPEGKYRLAMGTTWYGSSTITCSGTEANPIIIEGTGGWQWDSRFSSGYVDLHHTTIRGTRAYPGDVGVQKEGATFYSNGGLCNLHNVTFDDCERTRITGASRAAGNTVSIRNCHSINSASTVGIVLTVEGQTSASSTCEILNSVFDDTIQIPYTGLTLNNCTVRDGVIQRLTGGSTQPTVIENCAFRGAQNLQLDVDMSSLFFLNDIDNVKLIVSNVATPIKLSNSVVENYGTTDSSGELFAKQTGRTLTAENCIFLPKPDRSDGCVVTSELGAEAGSLFTTKNCTCYYRGANVGHGPGGPTPPDSMVVKDSIFWVDTPNGGFGCQNLPAFSSPDAARADDLDFNCFHNIAAGSRYPGMVTTSGSYGLNDLVLVDPQFQDPNVNLVAFSQSVGGPATQDLAWDELEKTCLQATGYNPAFTVAALLAFIFDGMTPTNLALQGAASDSGDIGAAPVNDQVSQEEPTVLSVRGVIADIGSFAYHDSVKRWLSTRVPATGAMSSAFTNVAQSGDPVLRVRRAGDAGPLAGSVSIATNNLTGVHLVTVDCTAPEFDPGTGDPLAFLVYIEDGLSAGVNVSGWPLFSFSVGQYASVADVWQLAGVSRASPPADDAPIQEHIAWMSHCALHKVLTNRLTGKTQVFDESGAAVIGEATVSDDGDQFIREKMESPS